MVASFTLYLFMIVFSVGVAIVIGRLSLYIRLVPKSIRSSFIVGSNISNDIICNSSWQSLTAVLQQGSYIAIIYVFQFNCYVQLCVAIYVRMCTCRNTTIMQPHERFLMAARMVVCMFAYLLLRILPTSLQYLPQEMMHLMFQVALMSLSVKFHLIFHLVHLITLKQPSTFKMP